MKRRQFIRQTSVATMALGTSSLMSYHASLNETAKAIPLTKGPKFHWFGYYDKLQTDPEVRYVLGMQSDFEHRSPTENDSIRIGMIDLKDGNRWIDIGESLSWGWQQGCMLQWIPGSKDEIIWNDRVNGSFVCHIYNITSGKKRTLPKAIYTLSPDGKWAIGTEFSRIDNLRPGYGYTGITDPYEYIKAPGEIGIHKIDLQTGEYKLLFSLADIAKIPHNGQDISDNFHWFNHLLVNPDGSRFTFLHRWRNERADRKTMAAGGYKTRMITASSDGKDIFLINTSTGFTSHFIWSDPSHILVWTRPEGYKSAYYILEDKTTSIFPLPADIITLDGHVTYVPNSDNAWLLSDTSPQGADRLQELYLFHIADQKKIMLGQFHAPKEYNGEWRCDLHPKCTPDGKNVIFDSAHEGNGRQIYMLDISKITSMEG